MGMRKVELYTYEDAAKDVEEGVSESEAAIRKWESIVMALSEVEQVVLQITPFCEKHIQFECRGCPIVKFDFPCNDPFSTYAIFYSDLKKLRLLAENMLTMLLAVQKSEERDSSNFV